MTDVTTGPSAYYEWTDRYADACIQLPPDRRLCADCRRAAGFGLAGRLPL